MVISLLKCHDGPDPDSMLLSCYLTLHNDSINCKGGRSKVLAECSRKSGKSLRDYGKVRPVCEIVERAVKMAYGVLRAYVLRSKLVLGRLNPSQY
jgi:hypothetical protein